MKLVSIQVENFRSIVKTQQLNFGSHLERLSSAKIMRVSPICYVLLFLQWSVYEVFEDPVSIQFVLRKAG